MGLVRHLVAAIASILFLQGCAEEKAQPFSVGFTAGPMFYESQLVQPQHKDLVDNRAAYFGDRDSDGLLDVLDPDLDGDGVPNLLDKAPFDPNIKEMLPHLKLEVAKKSYYVVLNDAKLAASEVDSLHRMLLFLQKSPSFSDQLQVIAIWDWTDEYDNMNGHYDPFWKTIRIRAPQAFKGKSRTFSKILGHELFHAFQKAEPALYEKWIEKVGWSLDYQTDMSAFTSGSFKWVTGSEDDLLYLRHLPDGVPTRRSLISPEEHFADSFLYAYLRQRNPDWIDEKYFDNLKAYKESENQKWTYQVFKRFFALPSK